MTIADELPWGSVNKTADIRSATPYVHVRTRKKTCLIISVILTLLIISAIVVIAKVVLTKIRTPTKTTGILLTELTATTMTKPILSTEMETATTTSMKAVQMNGNMTWNPVAVTVAGGNSHGAWFDQLTHPIGIDIDTDLSIYIADRDNHRVVRWRLNARFGEVLAGGNGSGNRTDQLSSPSDVVIDRKNSSLIICDRGNTRLLRVLHNSPSKQARVLLQVDCNCLTMDNNGYLYFSRIRTHTIQRWKEGEAYTTTIAGQNEKGNRLDQLHSPEDLFVDDEYSVYISDSSNHRVMKWMKGAKEGVVVAGGNGRGNSSTQLNEPFGLTVDHFGNIYVSDEKNSRIMRYLNGSLEGAMIAGRLGQYEYTLDRPHDIAFDQHGNLYVVDPFHYRVQKFNIYH